MEALYEFSVRKLGWRFTHDFHHELVTIFGRVNKVLLDEVQEDAKKNLVKRMLKININMLKCGKSNATTILIGAQNFFKSHIFEKFSIFQENSENK